MSRRILQSEAMAGFLALSALYDCVQLPARLLFLIECRIRKLIRLIVRVTLLCSALQFGATKPNMYKLKNWKPTVYWTRLARRSKAHAGKVGTGVLAGIAVVQRVEIVHCAHLACPLARRALVYATKTAGIAPGSWIRILTDVASVTTELWPVCRHLRTWQKLILAGM